MNLQFSAEASSSWPHYDGGRTFKNTPCILFGSVDVDDVVFFQEEIAARGQRVDQLRDFESLPRKELLRSLAEAIDVGLGVVLCLEADGKADEAEALSEVLVQARLDLMSRMAERWLGHCRSMGDLVGLAFDERPLVVRQ